MDDDDEFLYGTPSVQPTASTSAPKPIPVEETQASNGVVAFLEDQAEQQQEQEEQRVPSQPDTPAVDEEGDEQEEEEEEEEDSDDDIEIVTEAPSRSLDFRQNRPVTNRVPSTNIPTQPRAQALAAALTTEYTPIARGAPTPNTQSGIPAATTQQSFGSPAQQQQQQQSAAQGTPQPGGAPASVQDSAEGVPDDGVDPNTLPPVKAPPSHPSIDPTDTGVYDGRSILEYDMNALADKPWRRPGADLSDWFNYGFDEISWEAYCYRRRDLGELAHVLKANVINFTAMSEDQITALPADMRSMAITSANNLMNQATQMMVPGVMDMGMVGPMGMGMNPGDMGMGGGMMPGMMQQEQNGVGMMQGAGGPGDVQQQGQVAPGGMMQDASGAYGNPNAAAGMMNMGMADYGMQDQNQMVQPMYPGMDVSQGVTPVQTGSGRGTPLGGGYSRGAPRGGGASLRARGGFAGRGRGGRYDAPSAPARPASPLPPNVPTGPRNQNKYKDRDGNAPAVDGLDYGGGGGGRRTPSHEPEDRSRKRRSSPGLDDVRSSKRR